MLEEKNKNELQTLLDAKNNSLINQIVDQEDSKQVSDLIKLFNLNHMKKQMIRSLTYNQLLDHITNQMEERVTKRPDQFSNKDLLDYMNTMGAAMDRAQKQLIDVDTIPAIQINQQNNIVNVGDSTPDLDRESRKKVMDAVSSILDKLKKSNINEEIIIDSQDTLVQVNNDEQEDEDNSILLNAADNEELI